MQFYFDNFHWVMLIAGLLTLTMARGLFAPHAAMAALFGAEQMQGAGAALVVRNWSFLIAATALFVLYAAFIDPTMRAPALILAGAGKFCFIALVFGAGARFARSGAFAAAIIDSVFVLLFAIYLIGAARS